VKSFALNEYNENKNTEAEIGFIEAEI